MSFLKNTKFKEYFNKAKEFVLDYVWHRLSIYMMGISILLSLFILQISKPEFYISATLMENQLAESSKVGDGGAATALLGIGASSSSEFDEFRVNIHSYVVAERMWAKGWGAKIFAAGDTDIDSDKIPKYHTIADKLQAWFLGYQLNDYFTPHDLQNFMQSSVSIIKKIKDPVITASMMSQDKDFALAFLPALIKEADQYGKEYLIAKSEATIATTFEQIAKSKNSMITGSLASTINSEYYKIATLDNDLPYHVYYTDPPHSSEYPVTPQIAVTLLSNLIIFLFLSIFFNFVKKNKEDLW